MEFLDKYPISLTLRRKPRLRKNEGLHKGKVIGFKGKFLVRIKPRDPSKYDEIALKLEKNHNITDLFRIGEQYGLFAIVRVKEIENYAIFIKDLYDSGEIEDTYTNFVLDELQPYTNFIIS